MKILHLTIDLKTWDALFNGFGYKGRRRYYKPFKKTCAIFNIRNEGAFLAQMCHESLFFKYKSEGLKYSADALLKIFKKYFKTREMAVKYQGKDYAIASRVYANRYGNGNERSGDGWRYRGRGPFQLTFKSNYKAFQKFLKGMKYKGKPIDCVSNPDILLNDELFFYSAAWFWLKKKCNQTNDFDKLTKIINGGFNGRDHRREIYRKIKEIANV